ncbi:chemotaxis protein CheB [Rhodopirellula europaea]|uniref:protein-glutamate O-methyltransferase n=1 Tax=Rhodopirellula europaea 6C TaxID=1263867 RepID=M2AYH9_9BACT|nr:chemotaxis protein CheB [Rhodopirellula europaea]EMB15029.1 signal transduction histidine kinase with CheB and CheR activity [Rhodopirellula europaea 6C]
MNNTDPNPDFSLPNIDALPSISTVVGIGASAGGLKALEDFFLKLPSDTGMTFIVVQHLSPDFKSLMDEILARFTTMKIVNTENGSTLEPNTIYLIPPNKNLAVADGRFLITDMDRDQIQRPVDLLFQSISKCFGPNAFAVVLSGTGSDGANGIRVVYENGGVTYAQIPETAQFDGMPKNAIATECITHVLTPADIAISLSEHANHPENRTVIDPLTTEEMSGIRLVFSLLSERHSIDFSGYKESTVARRLNRRIHSRNCKGIQQYAELLRTDRAEVDALYHDLLIGVTKFFRDTEAFFSLQARINRFVSQLEPDEELRIWVAGCASGEEAYTMAMIAVEAFARRGLPPNLKVLATDAHQGALDRASRGLFSAESLEFVSRQRQNQFFTQISKTQYRITPEVRQLIVFAKHNLIEDPPFTKIHVVTCRNMLIYFKPPSQNAAIASLHFALEKDGLMMLGSSETPGKLQDEFETLDNTWRIYRKLRSLPLAIKSYDQLRAVEQAPRRLVNILNRDQPEKLSFTGLLKSYDLLLGEFVDCGLLLDEHRNVLHVFGNASQYLQNSSGRFTGNLLRMMEGEARRSIGAALVRSARDSKSKIVIRDIPFEIAGEIVDTDVTVRVLHSTGADAFVWFIEFGTPTTPVATVETEVRVSRPGDQYDALEAELTFVKDSLSATIEELETSNEELQSTNEELIASNEELQSTNQELHSVNEELYSVNAENHRKITELQEVTEDIENLLSSTDIGTLFVDENLFIRRFTPAATRYFNLVDHDIGRSLSSFTHTMDLPDLSDQIHSVLNTGKNFIREISTVQGDRVLLRVVPYMSGSERKGAIVNILDFRALRDDVDSADQH